VRLAVRIGPLLAVTGLLVLPGHIRAAVQSAALRPLPQREHPLNCRGGEQLVFDTIGSPSDPGKGLRLLLTFVANPTAAGQEGRGLRPSTCAWVDRPVSDEEPRQVRVTIHLSDSTPRLTVRDTGVYWSFLARNSDSGHFTGAGYRHWHASSPPGPTTHPPRASIPTKRSRPPFNARQLPWLAVGWVAVTWVPFMMLIGMWSGWRRLAGLYPDRKGGRGRSFRCGSMVMGKTNYRGGTRLTADDSHLHFSMSVLMRPGHAPFSVPWSDITVSRDEWPWFPLKGVPVIRLTLTRHPSLRILVPVSHGETIVTASGGRLHSSRPRAPAGLAR
jgi:hypothetical protein